MDIKRVDRKITDNFYLSEFGWVEPYPHIAALLQELRERTSEAVTITRGASSIEHHIAVYKRVATMKEPHKDWRDIVRWTSRHLPSHTHSLLRAVDIKCRKGDKYYTGLEVYKMVEECKAYNGHFWGIGIGRHYVHVDSGDRTEQTRWRYDY